MTNVEAIDGAIVVLVERGWLRGLGYGGTKGPVCVYGAVNMALVGTPAASAVYDCAIDVAMRAEAEARNSRRPEHRNEVAWWNDVHCKDADDAIAFLKAVRARVLATEEQR